MDVEAQLQLIEVILLITFFGIGFFCSLSETALFTLKGPILRKMQKSYPKKTKIISTFLEHPRETLTALTLLNTTANFGVAFLALWMTLKREFAQFPFIIISLLILIIGCEIIPKTFAMRHPDRWALRVAPVLQILKNISTPIHFLVRLATRNHAKNNLQNKNPNTSVENSENEVPFSYISNEEYRELVELAFQQKIVTSAERDFINRIVLLDSHTVKECMILRSQMSYISANATKEEMIEAARRYKHRRLPMYDEQTNDIVGILNTHVLLMNPDKAPDDAIDLALTVPDSMNLLELLKSFQRQYHQGGLVIVLDEYGETSGIITMEDILEEVVGNIRPESEVGEATLEVESINSWKVSGNLPIEDFNQQAPSPIIPPQHVQTIAGIFLSQLETIPYPNQSIQYDKYRFTALSVEFAKIREVRIIYQSAGASSSKTSNPKN